MCSSEEVPRIGYTENSCIKEVSEKYRNIASMGEHIYRLEKIAKEGLTVSVWHHHEWYYQGLKKHNYFNDSKAFTYSHVNCPDNKGSNADLSNRLRKVKSK